MEPSKKYLIHCIAWNALGFIVLMSPVLEVVSDALAEDKMFLLWSAAIFAIPLVLFSLGIYLLWRGIPRRKLIIGGMVISALFLLIELWGIDGLFMPSVSSRIFDCRDEFKIPPSYTCPQ
jgi:hypothetical protein